MTWGLGGVIAAAWIAAGLVWLIGSFSTKRTVRSQSAGSRLLEIAPVGVAVVLLRMNPGLTEWLALRFVPNTLEWQGLGAVVTIAGVFIAIWARFYLGSNWSATVTVKQDHQLIRSGPYSVVRHPIYSGFLLGMLGTAIYVGELRGLCAVALATWGWKMKSRREEAFMESEFGGDYLQYRRDVKALVPYVW
jgi:protein-S-isoprenylcysteine O-methyltransferase Ste14